MKKPTHLVFAVTILVAAVALVASAILLVDYVRPAPVFCDENGGCEAVKQTIWAHPFGIPLPAFGLAGLLGIALAALTPGRWARIAQATMAIFAGIAALFLLGIQARMRVLCPFCAVVDTSSVVLAALSVARLRAKADPPAARPVLAAATVALLLSIAVPSAVGFSRTPPPPPPPPPPPSLAYEVPNVITEEMRRSPQGVVTVIDFADFECPFCRNAHALLAPLLEARKDKVRVVRRHVPLRIHPHALDAARAGCCGEEKSDALADALFRADLEQLTPGGCAKIAAGLGLDPVRFKACVEDPATDARIAADRSTFREAKGTGLPMIWVNGIKLEGRAAQDRQTLMTTLDDAIRRL